MFIASPERMGLIARSKSLNIVAAGWGFVILLGFVILFLASRKVYHSAIDLWSFAPFRYPFLDAEYVSAQIDCWRKGVDVYVANPCDVLGRVQNLSPLWLRLPFWPWDKSWTNVLGLTIDTIFLVSLVALPRPRHPVDAIPLLISILSPSLIFALERANQDLVIFVLVIVAVLLLEGSIGARILGYVTVVAAALLKFYPIVLLILLLREGRRTFFAVAACTIVVIIGCAWLYRLELVAAVANIPFPATFSPGFGGSRLPDGIGVLLTNMFRALGFNPAFVQGLPGSSVLHFMTYLVAVSGACAIAMRIARSTEFASTFVELTPRESLCLVSGAALICGCFFAGTNALYREVYFLLVFPGLFAMARISSRRPVDWIARSTGWLALLMMFFMPFDRLAEHIFGTIQLTSAPLITSLYWLCCELIWWWIVAVLLGILLLFFDVNRARDIVFSKRKYAIAGERQADERRGPTASSPAVEYSPQSVGQRNFK